MFEWMTKKNRMEKKNPGLIEKEAATQRKFDVAMSILDKRKECIPVENDRRKNDDFHGYLKPV